MITQSGGYLRHTYTAESMLKLMDIGLTQWTPVQVFMALDEWCAADAEMLAAHDKVDAYLLSIHPLPEETHSLKDIWACQVSEEYRNISNAITNIYDKVAPQCPLYEKSHRYAHEWFPVSKTLKDAASRRNATKKLMALIPKAKAS